jgi:hypothetical protein
VKESDIHFSRLQKEMFYVHKKQKELKKQERRLVRAMAGCMENHEQHCTPRAEEAERD